VRRVKGSRMQWSGAQVLSAMMQVGQEHRVWVDIDLGQFPVCYPCPRSSSRMQKGNVASRSRTHDLLDCRNSTRLWHAACGLTSKLVFARHNYEAL
jgi:hypothetical protein